MLQVENQEDYCPSFEHSLTAADLFCRTAAYVLVQIDEQILL